jgi:SlyX protein
MDRDTGARLTQIETKLAWLEDFLTRLQTTVVDYSAAIDRFAAEHAAMKSRLLQISHDLEEVPNKRPPHY